MPGKGAYDVLIAGGGFAGFWAAVAARRVLGHGARIALLSPSPRLVMRPRLYQAAPETLHVNLGPYLASVGIDLIAAEANALDAAHGQLRAGAIHLNFGRLVVATGSRIRMPDVPGVQLAHNIDDQSAAVALDVRLRELMQDGTTPNIAVIGAGFTGIECVLELRDRLAAHGSKARAEAANIVLVDPNPVVGHSLGNSVRPAIEAALAEARVETLLGRRLVRIARDHVELDSDIVLQANITILATGTIASPFASKVPGDHDTTGRVVVDHYLRAPAAPKIFVGGDAAAADTGNGLISLQSCQHALQMGRFAGENAARSLLNLSLLEYQQRNYVTCLDLGRSGALFTEGIDRQVRFSGPTAKARKRHINEVYIYPPALGAPEVLLEQSRVER